ncbi:MAG: hypothetical protein Ct9H300mP5_1290 [Candidatus Pelagibacterales bacterium]|nr:MAG: hypothetical protein Ct9H300mP5_1290 [Pelagibacterales bacterium]
MFMYHSMDSPWDFFIDCFTFLISFIFKNKNFPIIAKSLAPSGFVFNIIALITGSFWGENQPGELGGLGMQE